MIDAHYPPLVAAYAVALVSWYAVSLRPWSPWREPPELELDHPWRETGYALAAAIAVILLGQLWVRGIRLPERGSIGPAIAAVNQILIFSPMPLLLLIRGHDSATAWLPLPRWGARLAIGVSLAAIAVTVYSLLRADAAGPFTIMGRILSYQHLDEAVQVLMEDVTIAILLARLAAATGRARAVVIVAALFAAGHIPALLASGAPVSQLWSLLLDATLAVAVLGALLRSRDILWFWCLHFAMDLTQFDRVSLDG